MFLNTLFLLQPTETAAMGIIFEIKVLYNFSLLQMIPKKTKFNIEYLYYSLIKDRKVLMWSLLDTKLLHLSIG